MGIRINKNSYILSVVNSARSNLQINNSITHDKFLSHMGHDTIDVMET